MKDGSATVGVSQKKTDGKSPVSALHGITLCNDETGSLVLMFSSRPNHDDETGSIVLMFSSHPNHDDET